MIKENAIAKRNLKNISLQADLIVVGGGLSGVCCAITAARAGIQVILVQDRPILGGNASSEVRLWVLGATAHMGNNNRWSREGGVIDEILVENTYRNSEGNPIIFDSIILEKVIQESCITLLLNTVVYEVEKEKELISSIKAFCSQNSTEYILKAPLFCDASGDGIIAFLSGAAFRMGAENKEEFGEKMAPTHEYGELLGHSLYFYSKDTGKPVKFIPPSFALTDITKIPRYKNFNAQESGCKLWWVEYGGRLDTVYDTEFIKWELWKIIYGVWNYIKNSGNFPEAETMTLEWVGTIPGKRESRRFEGDYILKQQDIIEQHLHKDAIGYGGWAIDLHPADGIYSEKPACNQWHSKGIFQIPYRSLYSKNICNLFLAGRIISVSHVAFGATRVMATCAYIAQAVGMAAALCKQKNILPANILNNSLIHILQNELMKNGQHIPAHALSDEDDLVKKANVRASSEYNFSGFKLEEKWKKLDLPSAQMFAITSGIVPEFHVALNALEDTILKAEIRKSSKPGNFTPDVCLAYLELNLKAGQQLVTLNFNVSIEEAAYVFLIFEKNIYIQLGYTEKRVTGILSVFNLINKAVSNYGKQTPPADSGLEAFEFWCPQRRPLGQNFAIELVPSQQIFKAQNIKNGINRPTTQPNAWVASPNDDFPELIIEWNNPVQVRKIELFFDTDFDHPMESVLMTHPENIMPFCINNYIIKDDKGNELYRKQGNYQTRNIVTLEYPVNTTQVRIEVEHPSKNVPAAIFSVRCYE
jgi:hypothetical protein